MDQASKKRAKFFEFNKGISKGISTYIENVGCANFNGEKGREAAWKNYKEAPDRSRLPNPLNANQIPHYITACSTFPRLYNSSDFALSGSPAHEPFPLLNRKYYIHRRSKAADFGRRLANTSEIPPSLPSLQGLNTFVSAVHPIN